MRRTLLLGWALAASPLAAQAPAGATGWADSARREIDAAVIRGDTARVSQARALVERALTLFPDDPWLLHYHGYALYREATMNAARSKANPAKLLEAAAEALERSAKLRPMAETYAVWSSVLGQQIGVNPMLGMTLGQRSSELMGRAEELGRDNPRVWLLKGISAIFTPETYGGGLEQAEKLLRRTTELYQRDQPAPPSPAWGRDEAWAWLGQVFQRTKRPAEAREAFDKALEAAPENNWVRFVLLPSVERGLD